MIDGGMFLGGLLVPAAAPVAWWLARQWPLMERAVPPAAVCLVGFCTLHFVLTAAAERGGVTPAVAHASVGTAALMFWAPVLGQRRRLADPLRAAYLFLALPVLDLGSVYLVADGHAVAGVSMVVGMLPVGLAALAVTWQWMAAEERLVGAEAGR